MAALQKEIKVLFALKVFTRCEQSTCVTTVPSPISFIRSRCFLVICCIFLNIVPKALSSFLKLQESGESAG